MRFTKRVLSALLALVMVFTMLPLQVWAEEVGSQDSDNSVNLVGMYGGARAAEPVAARVELDEGSAMIAVGGQHSFTPKLISNLGEPMEDVQSYHWKSDHPEIATVDNGVVTGVAEGITRITCVYDDLETTAVVTVTQATYQVTYEIEYPQDAKKVAYMNGGAATIITPQNTKITISCAPGTNVVIPSNLASAINYNLTGFSDGSNTYTIGETIDVSSNITLKSSWGKIEGTTGTEVEITVHYNYNNRVANKRVKAFVVEESNISGRATFITANNNDTFASDDPRMCGWTIGGENYGLNQQVTVPVKRENNSSEWIVDAYARLEAVGNTEAYAEFFVRKSDKVGEEGFGADKYFSVGSRKISTETDWNTSTRINGAENVSKYLSNPPTAEEVANLMNESLPAGAVVEWNHLSKLSTGYHVDGVIRTVGKYWNVKFIDPDTNVCLQQVPVMDEGTIPAIYDGNALNTSVRTFKGWSFQPEGEIVTNLEGKTINGDITLYAVFERKPAYTVKAELYVGTPNQKGELLAVKVENDLTFDQLCKMYLWKSDELATHFWKSVKLDDMHSSPVWYPDNADTYKQSPDEHVVKLYLKKDNVPSITAILTYNGNVQSGTVNNLPDPVKTIKGEAVKVSSNIPIREGYTFKGWNTDANGNGISYLANELITLDKNTTLYAQWTANTADYRVEHHFENLDGQYVIDGEKTISGENNINTVFTRDQLKLNPVPNGYSLDEGKTKENFTITDDVEKNVFQIYYKLNRNNVTYRLDKVYDFTHPTVPDVEKNIPYGQEVTVNIKNMNEGVVGYTFTGWSTADAEVKNNEFSMPDKPVVFTGSYTINSHKVTYKLTAENGSYTGVMPVPAVYAYDDDVNVWTPNVAEGYEFSGWTVEGADVEGGQEEFKMPDNDVTLTGTISRKQYTVRYAYGTGSARPEGYQLPENSAPYPFGSVVENLADPNAQSAEGYTFDGWFTDEGCSENSRVIDDYAMPIGGGILYGKFTANEYTVTYDLAEDSEIPANYTAPVDTNKYHIGSTVTVKADEQVPGYDFEGWYTEDGEVTEAMSTFTMPADNVTMYGKFTFARDTKYTVEHYFENLDGGYPAEPNHTESKVGTTSQLTEAMPIPAGSITGFTVDGSWKQQAIKPDGSTVVKIYYTRNSYNLTVHYRNVGGAAVADSYHGTYKFGETWKVVSPIVAGYYDPQIRSISSGANGMPAQNLEYVVIYTAIPAPVDPDPEGPNPGPNVPDDDDDDDDTPPVPNPEQEQPPQPQDFEIDPDDYTLTEVEDNETPLANLNLEGHTCCILHLLLMLAAMVVLGFDTKSRKKHQARIFELKKMLAMEEDHSDDPEQP